MQPDRNTMRFVRALIGGATGRRVGEAYGLQAGEARLRAPERVVARLAADGVLEADGHTCRAGSGARTWLRRSSLEAEHFAGQHRELVKTEEGLDRNLAESPLARLARPARGESQAFLDRAQLEAGERIRRLADRARLQPRLTMSYSATHTVNAKLGVGAGEISDLAADARRQLQDIVRLLPPDCAGVVLDVCGFSKGLRLVEAERGWPRRSAKLVLRIGLDQVARHLGLSAAAQGPQRGRQRGWMGEDARPSVFG